MTERPVAIAWGDPFEGLHLVGPFPSTPQARLYAETDPDIADCTYWLVPIDPPADISEE